MPSFAGRLTDADRTSTHLRSGLLGNDARRVTTHDHASRMARCTSKRLLNGVCITYEPAGPCRHDSGLSRFRGRTEVTKRTERQDRRCARRAWLHSKSARDREHFGIACRRMRVTNGPVKPESNQRAKPQEKRGVWRSHSNFRSKLETQPPNKKPGRFLGGRRQPRRRSPRSSSFKPPGRCHRSTHRRTFGDGVGFGRSRIRCVFRTNAAGRHGMTGDFARVETVAGTALANLTT